MFDIELYDINIDEDYSGFYCEDILLNNFLIRESKFEHIMHLSRTKIVKIEGGVVGFFTLEFRNVIIPHDGDENEYPSIALKCIAIDEKYENKGIGSYLIEYITVRSKDVSELIGCRCLFLDARVSKLKWYKERGFKFIRDEYNDIVLDELMARIKSSTVEMYIDFRDKYEIENII